MKRKVINAAKHWLGTMWTCRLECGHQEQANGTLRNPPVEVDCTTCAAQPTQPQEPKR